MYCTGIVLETYTNGKVPYGVGVETTVFLAHNRQNCTTWFHRNIFRSTEHVTMGIGLYIIKKELLTHVL